MILSRTVTKAECPWLDEDLPAGLVVHKFTGWMGRLSPGKGRAMKHQEPLRVSDHAVLRYMERAMGLNVEIVREHIATICTAAAACGAVSLRSEGVRFEIAGNTVVTVTPDRSEPSNTTRSRNRDNIRRQKTAYNGESLA